MKKKHLMVPGLFLIDKEKKKKALDGRQVPFSPMTIFKKNWWPLGAPLVNDEEKRDLMATRCLHSSQRGEKGTWWPLGCLLVHKDRKKHMVGNMCISNPQREKKKRHFMATKCHSNQQQGKKGLGHGH
jgi:hypothetical protein